MRLGARTGAWAKSGGGGWVNPYVTDGLVAMWDGEWNAGGGVHQSSVTELAELTGNFSPITLNGDYEIGDNFVRFLGVEGASFAGSGYGIAPKVDMTDWDGISIEVVYELESYNKISVGWTLAGYDFRPSIYCHGELQGIYGFLMGSVDDNVPVRSEMNLSGFYTKKGLGEESSCWEKGIKGVNNTTTAIATYKETPNHFRLSAYGSSIDTNSEVFKGKYHTIRVYSRSISDAEKMANLAVDRERFSLPF